MCRKTFLIATLLLASIVTAKPKAPPVDPNAAPVPPKDAQWTLYCQAVAGTDHVERANALKKQLLHVIRSGNRLAVERPLPGGCRNGSRGAGQRAQEAVAARHEAQGL